MSDVSLGIDSGGVLGWRYILGWREVRVSRTMNALCGDFSFSLSNFPFNDLKLVQKGAEVKVKIGNEILTTGYIDKTRRELKPNTTRLEFNGRDKTSVLLRSSAIYQTNNWRKKKLTEIAADLCNPFGIEVTLLGTGIEDSEIKEFSIQTGETVFAAVERLCRASGVLPLTDSTGSLLLTTVGDAETDVSLEVGNNIKEVTYETDESGQHSEYLVKGQSRGRGQGWLKDKINLKGSATDEDASRYSPLVLVAEKGMNATEIANRAAWEAQIRAGRAERAIVVVRGWMQNMQIPALASRPWAINELVTVIHDDWDMDLRLLITSVTFEMTEQGGKTTTLELNPPEIYRANPTEKVQLSRRSRVKPND